MTEKRKAYLKEYRKRPDVKERQKEYFKKWFEKGGKEYLKKVRKRHNFFPDINIVYERQDLSIEKKNVIYNKLYRAIKNGKLKKPKNCYICKKRNKWIEGHHQDYLKPLEILWLCTSCHRRLHINENNQGITA